MKTVWQRGLKCDKKSGTWNKKNIIRNFYFNNFSVNENWNVIQNLGPQVYNFLIKTISKFKSLWSYLDWNCTILSFQPWQILKIVYAIFLGRMFFYPTASFLPDATLSLFPWLKKKKKKWAWKLKLQFRFAMRRPRSWISHVSSVFHL